MTESDTDNKIEISVDAAIKQEIDKLKGIITAKTYEIREIEEKLHKAKQLNGRLYKCLDDIRKLQDMIEDLNEKSKETYKKHDIDKILKECRIYNCYDYKEL